MKSQLTPAQLTEYNDYANIALRMAQKIADSDVEIPGGMIKRNPQYKQTILKFRFQDGQWAIADIRDYLIENQYRNKAQQAAFDCFNFCFNAYLKMLNNR